MSKSKRITIKKEQELIQLNENFKEVFEMMQQGKRHDLIIKKLIDLQPVDITLTEDNSNE